MNELIKRHCLSNHIVFIDCENTNLGMLNKSGLNENDTKWLVNKTFVLI